MNRLALLSLALSPLALWLSGCSGSGTAPVSGPVTTQTFGSLTTRIVGTAQPPVFSTRANGANVTGLAGALIDQVLLNRNGTPTYRDAKIAFQSFRDGNEEIYAMKPDGTGAARLTNNTSGDLWPVWSPDGSKIAFTSLRDGNHEVYVMNADGTNQVRLTTNAAVDAIPTWSPDGSKLAFTSDRNGNLEIYAMNADGTNQTRLTNNASVDSEPAWSPDGSKITFSSNRNGGYEIYTMNVDGTNPLRLTFNMDTDDQPTWSPDGTRIAFTSDRDTHEEIYVMNADGTGQARLTGNNLASESAPSWSPDGSRIVFVSDRDGNAEVYSISATGGVETNLTKIPSISDRNPSWSKFLPRPTVKLVGSGTGVTLSTAAGVLFGQKGSQVTSCLAFDTSPTSRTASRISALTSAETESSNLVFSITVSVELLNMAFVNIDENGTPGPFTIPALLTGGTGAVVSFDGNTGYVSSVIPYAANRGSGGLKHSQSENILTISAPFTGVFDAQGKNQAPDGVKTVQIDTKTGKVVHFE